MYKFSTGIFLKMSNITNYQGNANETTTRYHLMLVRMATIIIWQKQTKSNKCWQVCGEIGALYTVGGNVKMVQPLCKEVWQFHKKI